MKAVVFAGIATSRRRSERHDRFRLLTGSF
jgi:hypothetical protein